MTYVDTYLMQKSAYLTKNFKDALIQHSPVVSDTMKEIGVFTRFFGHYITRPTAVFELDGVTYNTFLSNPFYTMAKLSWYVRGPKYTVTRNIRGTDTIIVGVEDSNKESVKEVLLTMPGLLSYINDYLQFYVGE